MEDSTQLSRTFANQGIRLRVRTKTDRSTPQLATSNLSNRVSKSIGRKKARTQSSALGTSSPQRPFTPPPPPPPTPFDRRPTPKPSLPSLSSMLSGVLPSHSLDHHSRLSNSIHHHALRVGQKQSSPPHSPVGSSASSSSSITPAPLHLHPRQRFGLDFAQTPNSSSSARSSASIASFAQPPQPPDC